MKANTANIVKKLRVIILLAIAAALSLGIYMYQGKEITLDIDGNVKELVSYANTVEELIETEEVDFKEGAEINVPLERKLENNLDIIIKNPKNYTIEDEDEDIKVVSLLNTVEEILKEQGIELGEEDYTYPEATDKVLPDSSIRIYRIKTEVDIEETKIGFEKEIKDTDKLNKGQTKVVQAGKEGIRETHTKRKYLNGVLISEEIEKEEVTQKPTNEIVERGTKEVVVAEAAKSVGSVQASAPSRGGNVNRSGNAINMTATAYDLSFQSTGKRPGDRGYGITASGTQARRGAVAVDPRVIPLGTKLYIESLDGTPDYGYATAEDTGGAIKGNRIDLFFGGPGEARQFGRRQVKVYILN